MLDLRPIKDRLAAATPGQWYREVTGVSHKGIRTQKTWLFADDGATEADSELVANAPTDLAALIEEVVRLRRSLDHYCRITDDNEAYKKRLRDAIYKHRTQCLLTGSVREQDTDLWEILDE